MTQKTFHTPCIAVYDSGIGGLSVLQAIQSKLPDARYIYYCDNGHFPYGSKNAGDVLEFVTTNVRKLSKHHCLDILVIACNTASTIVLPTLRNEHSFTIVGVVPAIKPAALQSKTKVLGLLATPATINRPYTHRLIRDYASNCHVISVGSTRLVLLAEEKMRGRAININDIRVEISDLFIDHNASDKHLDTVILGCTHFPFLKSEFEKVAKWKVEWIDSGNAISERVVSLVKNIDLNKMTKTLKTESNIAYFSESHPNVSLLKTTLESLNICEIGFL